MKTLLALIAFFPLMVNGQTLTEFAKLHQGTIWPISDGIDSTYSNPQTDTTAVILLVCDTVHRPSMDLVMWNSETQRLIHEHPVFWIRGYEVTKTKSYMGSPEPNDDGTVYAVLVTKYYNEHAAYLGMDKKRINYLVWDSKKIRK